MQKLARRDVFQQFDVDAAHGGGSGRGRPRTAAQQVRERKALGLGERRVRQRHRVAKGGVRDRYAGNFGLDNRMVLLISKKECGRKAGDATGCQTRDKRGRRPAASKMPSTYPRVMDRCIFGTARNQTLRRR